MSVGSVSLSNNLYAGNINPNSFRNKSKDINYHEIESLVNHSNEQASTKGRLIGMAGFMSAAYAMDTTIENPLIDVFVEGQTLTIDVNKVDPTDATDIEMFAYCEYMDDQGLMPNSGMGSYTTLMIAKDMALHNGFIEDNGSGSYNWVEMAEKVKDLVYRCGDMIQYMKINEILDVIDRHNGKIDENFNSEMIDWNERYNQCRKPMIITTHDGTEVDMSISLSEMIGKPCIEIGTGRVLYDGNARETVEVGDKEVVSTEYGYSCYVGDEGTYMLKEDLEKLIVESQEKGEGWIRTYREILGDKKISEIQSTSVRYSDKLL